MRTTTTTAVVGRVFGYNRVSSIEQAKGISLESQHHAIERASEGRLGVKVERIFTEAESGVGEKRERRVEMNALLAQLRAGDVVIVDKLDRWSRSLRDTVNSIHEIRKKGARFIALSDNVDSAGPDGDFNLHIYGAIAEREHGRIKERLVGNRKYLRDEGYYSEGHPPFGYVRSEGKAFRGPRTKNVLKIVEDEAACVRLLFEECASGKSVGQIARETGMKEHRVLQILNSRLYTGEVKNSKGEWIQGVHPPIVSMELFVRAKDARRLRTTHGIGESNFVPETAGWLLRDVARCAKCGAKMRAMCGGPPPKRRQYYRCRARCQPGGYVPRRAVEEAFYPMVLARLIELREELAKEPEPESGARPVVDLTKRIATLQTKRERWIKLWVDQKIDEARMNAEVRKLDDEIMHLRIELTPKPVADPKVRAEHLANMTELAASFMALPPTKQRTIVGQLTPRVTMALGQGPSPSWFTLEELVFRAP